MVENKSSIPIDIESLKGKLLLASQLMGDGLLVLVADKIIHANKKASNILGVREEDLLNKSLDFILEKDAAKKLLFEIQERKGEGFFYEAISKNQKKFQLEYRSESNLKVGDNVHIFIVSEKVDTDSSVDSLFEAIGSLVLASSLDGFILADPKGQIMKVNESYCNMSGYLAEELLSMNISDLEASLNEEEIAQRVKATFEEGQAQFRTAHRKKDGLLLEMEVSLTIIERSGENYVAAFCRDVTEKVKLENTLLRTQQSLDRSFLPTIWSDFTGRILYANEAVSNYLGYTQAELLNMYVWDIDINFSTKFWEAEGKSILREKNNLTFETVHQRKDGSTLAVEVLINYFQYEGNEYLTDYILDITDRKTYQKQLKESEEHARLLFDQSAVIIWVEDFSEAKNTFEELKTKGVKDFEQYFRENPNELQTIAESIKVIEVNKKSLDFYQAKDLDDLEINLKKWFVEESYECFKDEIIAICSGANYFEGEIPIRTPSGEIKYLFLSVSVPEKYRHKLEKVLVSFVDITERKAAEKALQQSNNYLRRAESIAKLGRITFETEEKIYHLSQEALRIIGLVDRKDGFRLEEIYERIHPEDRNFMLEQREKFLVLEKGKQAGPFTFRILRPNGETRTVKLMLEAEYGREKMPKKFLGAMLDITELKKVEDELIQYKDQLELLVDKRTRELAEVNKELESFSYSVSHDLRAPLTRLDGFSKALVEQYADVIDQQGQHYLNRIRTSSKQMSQLIDDILSLSRLGKTDLTIKSFDLGAICVEIFNKLKADSPDHEFHYKIFPALNIEMDEQLCRILMSNLLQNAWKFSFSKASPFIEVGIQMKNGHEWYFVQDNGIGFDMKYYDQLFAPFKRLHSAVLVEGNGIGLAMVRRIIQKHGGEIMAESEIDKGSTFYFRLT